MRQKQEQARIAALYGLSIDRIDAADKARQTARAGVISGLGEAAGGVAGLFAPGGSLYNTNLFGGGGSGTYTGADAQAFVAQNNPNTYTMDVAQTQNQPIVTQQPIPEDPLLNINVNQNPYGIE